jgi:hypothetical protein
VPSSDRAERAAPSSPRSASPPRGYDPNPRLRPRPRAARRPHRSARRPCTFSASPTLLARLAGPAQGRWLRALARLERGAGAEKRPRFAGNEGSAAREAAFRIEPRAPASHARRRAGVRAERAVGATRPGGRAVTPCLPDSRACAGGFAGAARAPRRRPSVPPARHTRGRGARWRGPPEVCRPSFVRVGDNPLRAAVGGCKRISQYLRLMA